MFGLSSKALALACAAAVCAVAAPAVAQNNPFMPATMANKAEMEKLRKSILKEVDEKMAKGPGIPPSPSAPGPNGAPGTPVAPIGAANGANVPGGMMPPNGIPGAPTGAPLELPKSAYEQAQSDGVRFIGCINGEPKFVQKSGLRVRFTAKELREAQKAGLVPECR